MSWFLQLELQIQSSIIGAISAILVILVKDIGFHFWKEHESDSKKASHIYKSYSDPMLLSCLNLFWRLRETLIDHGRGKYLKTSGQNSDFDRYKFLSTQYRLATLIGWVRAYQRELAFLSITGNKHVKSLTDAVDNFQSSLADGAHIEELQLKSIAALLKIKLPADRAITSQYAAHIHEIVKKYGKIENLEFKEGSIYNTQLELWRELANYLCKETGNGLLTDEEIGETLGQAVISLSIRQAWIYRDFQSGIGDLMIIDIEGANRRFDIIGFKTFEEMSLADDKKILIWMKRLNSVFDGLDTSSANQFDARLLMLEGLFLSVIDLLLALTDKDKNRSNLAGAALEQAKKLKSNQAWRKTT